MASILDEIVTHGAAHEALDEDKAARSVVISNISPHSRDEDIVIHFQKRKNGGGEIDHLHIVGDGTAVITFDCREVAEKVQERPHIISGSQLELSPYRSIPEEPPEVFQRVSARVNLEVFQLSSQESRELLGRVQNETKADWHEACDGFILSGTFDQVEASRRLLQDLIGRRSHLHFPAERRGETNSRTEGQDDVSDRLEESSENFNPADICTFEVQPQFMKLLKRSHKEKLVDLEKNFSLNIIWEDNAAQVKIRPFQMSDTARYPEGCDAFIALYQKVFPEMKRQLVTLEIPEDDVAVQKAINAIEAENPVLIEKVDGQLSVYGHKNAVGKAIQDLMRRLGVWQDRNRNNRCGNKTIHEGPNGPPDGTDFRETSKLDLSSSTNALQHVVGKGVKISLYQGDITDANVDAIVNAANEWLRHGAGVAGAILAKGGQQINEDSRQVLSQRKKLEVGEAVYTRSGKLVCKYVIHAVGPRWEQHGREGSILLLRRACIESLRLAGRMNLRSIALPAISSGIFGVPKGVCAEVMLAAVEEFSESVDAQCCSLRDVRFVIIDMPTIEVFHGEFVKRYLSQGELPMSSTNQSGRLDKDRTADKFVNVAGDDTMKPEKSPSNVGSKDINNSGDVPIETGRKGSRGGHTKSTDKRCRSSKVKRTSPGGNVENRQEKVPHIKHEEEQNNSTQTPEKRKNSFPNEAGHHKTKDAENVKADVQSQQGVNLPESNSDKTGKAMQPPGKPGMGGRGRSPLAVFFPPKKDGKVGPAPEDSTQTVSTPATSSATAGRGRGMRVRDGDSIKYPPGLDVTPEGLHLAKKAKIEEQDKSGWMSSGEENNSKSVAVVDNNLMTNDLEKETSEQGSGGGQAEEDIISREVSENQQTERHLQSDRENISANELPGHDNNVTDYDIAERKLAESESWSNLPTNSKTSGTECSNGDQNFCESETADGTQSSLLTGSVDDVLKDEEMTPESSETLIEMVAASVATTGDLLDAESQSDAPRNQNKENVNTQHSNEGETYESNLEVDTAPSQAPSYVNDLPINEEGASVVPETLVENEGRLPPTTEGVVETESRRSPSRNEDVENVSSDHSSKDHSLREGEADQSPGSVGDVPMGEERSSEDPFSSSTPTIETPKEVRETESETVATEEGTIGGPDHTESNGTHPSNGNIKSMNTIHSDKDQAISVRIVADNGEPSRQSKVSFDIVTMDEDKASEIPVVDTSTKTQDTSEEKRETPIENVATTEEATGGLSALSAQLDPSEEKHVPFAQTIGEGRGADGSCNQPSTTELCTDPSPPPFDEIAQSSLQGNQLDCSVCLHQFNDPVNLPACGHTVCKACVDEAFETRGVCPLCARDDIVQGSQPVGYMTWRTESRRSLPGYKDCDTIVINYNISDGIQGSDHPSPGKPFRGIFCTCYLPENLEGQKVLKLLKRAFDARLLFKVGTSPFTGEENLVVLNDIEHKMNRSGGPANYGYPDPSYLDRVKKELAEKGIF